MAHSSAPAPDNLSAARHFGFGIGAIGLGLFSAVPSVILLYYLTEQLKLPLELAGIAAAAPKFWALFTDPAIGRWSDRTRTAFGRRRPFLLGGGLLFCACFIALFSLPVLSTAITTFLLAITAYLACATAYSMYAVPYIALPAELAANYTERSRLMAQRMGWGMTGILVGSAGAPLLVEAFGGGARGYSLMAMVLAGVCLISMFFPVFSVREPDATPVARSAPLTQLLKDPAYIRLALVYLLALTAIGLMTASVPYYVVRDMHRSEGDVGMLLGVVLVIAIIATPVWYKIALWLGRPNALLLCFVVYAISLFGIYLTQPDWSALIFWCALVGIGFSGLQLIPFTMLADLIAARNAAGDDIAGLYTGAWTAFEKLGLGLGPLLAAYLLKLSDYERGASVLPVFALAPAVVAVTGVVLLLLLFPKRHVAVT